MNCYNESSVVCSHHKIELFVLFHYLNTDLNTIKKICNENKNSNNEIELSNFIDLEKFQNVFKYNVTKTSVWGRVLDETNNFFLAIKEYYNVDLQSLDEYQLLDFLFKHNQDFNSPKDLIKLNCFELGARGFEIKLTSIKKMTEKLNNIKNILIRENNAK